MIKNILKISTIGLILFLMSCNGNSPNPPYVYQTNPTFTWGFAEFYGNYYHNYSIDDNVLNINLFSEGLGVDAEKNLVGIGQYLILEDVFVNAADTLLPAGTYTAVDSIIDVKPFTFLKGKEYKEKTSSDGIPSGAYIYYFENEVSKNTIKYIVSGTFTVSYNAQNSKYTITCDFDTKDKKEIKGTFTGELPHYDRSINVKAGAIREKMFMVKFKNHEILE